MKIISNNGALKANLYALVEVLKSQGACIHENLRVIETGGNLSVNVEGSSPQKNLIEIPVECLIPISIDDIKVVEQKFILSETATPLDEPRKQIRDLLLELYNICNKAKLEKETIIWASLADQKPLLEHLAKVRPSTKVQQLAKLAINNKLDELVTYSFFSSRWLDFKNEEKGKHHV